MKRKIGIAGLLILLTTVSLQAREFVDYVNPLMGTESTFEFSHGNTYPAVAVPWGVNFGLRKPEKIVVVGYMLIPMRRSEDSVRHTSPAHG